jgi:hypothetical protein
MLRSVKRREDVVVTASDSPEPLRTPGSKARSFPLCAKRKRRLARSSDGGKRASPWPSVVRD